MKTKLRRCRSRIQNQVRCRLLRRLCGSDLAWLGLGLLILGNGFFKPNISTLVGKMYKPGDARRDGAFSIFYMGINLGAFISPIVCGYLGQKVGWHWGFGAAVPVSTLAVVCFGVVQILSPGCSAVKLPKTAPATGAGASSTLWVKSTG